MVVGIFVKKLISAIADCSAFANLDRFSQGIHEPLFISNGEIMRQLPSEFWLPYISFNDDSNTSGFLLYHLQNRTLRRLAQSWGAAFIEDSTLVEISVQIRVQISAPLPLKSFFLNGVRDKDGNGAFANRLSHNHELLSIFLLLRDSYSSRGFALGSIFYSQLLRR